MPYLANVKIVLMRCNIFRNYLQYSSGLKFLRVIYENFMGGSPGELSEDLVT